MKYAWTLILVVALSISGCDSSSSSFTFKKTKNKAEVCIDPQNPYNDGGGHDAGFNWASENGGACNGNSESFNEGCAEYHRQLNEYNACIANNRE